MAHLSLVTHHNYNSLKNIIKKIDSISKNTFQYVRERIFWYQERY